MFESNLKSYVSFYSEHIALEEMVVIPEALKVLEESDWHQLDAKFVSHCNPVSGKCPREPLYDRLYARIALHSPARPGVGRYHVARQQSMA